MKKNNDLEMWISHVEKFSVSINLNGRNVRSDKKNFAPYRWKRAAKSSMTVAEWKKTRFSRWYGPYTVDVLDGYGRKVSGQTTLRTVRSSY